MACGGEEGRIALVHESGKVLEVLQEMAPHDEGVASTQPVLSLAWGARSRYNLHESIHTLENTAPVPLLEKGTIHSR